MLRRAQSQTHDVHVMHSGDSCHSFVDTLLHGLLSGAYMFCHLNKHLDAETLLCMLRC